MRNVLSRLARPLLVLGLVLTAACASAPAEEAAPAAGGEPGTVTLRIMNNHRTAGEVTVFLVPDAGVRRSLGRVAQDATGTFSLPTDARGWYRFVAQRATGGDIQSPRFNAQSGTYTWDMDVNRVTQAR